MTSTVKFFEGDFAGTLFPLKTNLILIQKHSSEISDYIYQRILNDSHAADNFCLNSVCLPRNHRDTCVEQ